jgi:hypothetical protein
VPLELRPPQGEVFLNDRRWRVLVAGRRFGKTFLSTVELMRAARDPGFTKTPISERLVWYVAPTYKNAKQNAWRPLKKLTQPYWRRRPNETNLSIELSWGARIELRGADNYDALRGVGLDFVVFDEYADMKPEAWTEIIRPALSDRVGRALWIGTPKGFSGGFHELWSKAATQPDWAAFRYTSLEGGNIPESEIRAAAADVDEKTFRQEYQASFENMSKGQVYYAFDRAANVQPLGWIPSQQLAWALDFNVDPMASVICQTEDAGTRADALMGRSMKRLRVLDEIVLPDSNIAEACHEFKRRTEKWTERGRLSVAVYGDAAGNSRTHAGASDWELVKQYFRNDSRYALTFHVPSADPPVKDRVTAVNALLKNSLGEVRLTLDPKCKELAKDLEQVHWKADASGNLTAAIDKSDAKRTHVSDSLGYLIHREFPVRAAGGGKQSVLA